MAERLVNVTEERSSTTEVSAAGPSHGALTLEEKDVQYVVVLRFDDSYLRTASGAIRFVQVIVAVIALICVTSCGTSDVDYLMLPLNLNLRNFVFVSVCAFFTSSFRIILHITGLIRMLPIKWHLFDLIVCSILSFAYLIASSLVASAVEFYKKDVLYITKWTLEQLVVAVVLGYLNMVLFLVSAVLSYKSWKGFTQFMARRLSSTQRSQQQPAHIETPAV